MLFDRVAPKLPVGWTWKDQEWTVDMTGQPNTYLLVASCDVLATMLLGFMHRQSQCCGVATLQPP